MAPWLAEWAEDHFRAREDIRVVSRQQWTPDLAEDVANAESVVFVDGAIDLEPGLVRVVPVEASPNIDGLTTHHLGAAELLALASTLYNSLPSTAVLLTVGAGSIELGEEFSAVVFAALPHACSQLKATVDPLLTGAETPDVPGDDKLVPRLL